MKSIKDIYNGILGDIDTRLDKMAGSWIVLGPHNMLGAVVGPLCKCSPAHGSRRKRLVLLSIPFLQMRKLRPKCLHHLPKISQITQAGGETRV